MSYFIISIVAEDGAVKYVCKGDYSEYSITGAEQYAVRFNTIEDTNNALSSTDFTKRNTYIDGSSSPPCVIWSGLGICNSRIKSSGYIKILKYTSEVVSLLKIEDELGESNEET